MNHIGWQKEKRLYLEQRRLWNMIADPLKEEYLVNKWLTHGVVVRLKFFVPYSDDDVKWMDREENRLEKQQTKSGVNGRLRREKREERETCLGGIGCQRRDLSYGVRSKEQDRASSSLYDFYTRQHPTEAKEAFHTDWRGRFHARCKYHTKGGHYRTSDVEVQPAFIYAHFGANMANFLVEQAELDRTDTIKGYYSLHDVTSHG